MGRNTLSITDRELDVLNILWNSSKPMFAAEIIAAKEDLGNNTVQAVIRSLKIKKLIDVADTTIRGNMVARSYKVLISKSEFYLKKATDDVAKSDVKISMPDIVAAFFDKKKATAKDIEELETWLEAKKRDLKGE